jgi:hypothetical protein
MPMTPTMTIDPTVMAANWGKGVNNANNAAKLAYKYSHPKRAFNANPQASQQAWVSGVQQAQTAGTYASHLAAADVNKAADNMTAYGANAWMASGTSKAYKFAAKAQNLANAISAVTASVDAMPKGRGANNIARMTAWAQQMSAYKGKI